MERAKQEQTEKVYYLDKLPVRPPPTLPILHKRPTTYESVNSNGTTYDVIEAEIETDRNYDNEQNLSLEEKLTRENQKTDDST